MPLSKFIANFAMEKITMKMKSDIEMSVFLPDFPVEPQHQFYYNRNGIGIQGIYINMIGGFHGKQTKRKNSMSISAIL